MPLLHPIQSGERSMRRARSRALLLLAAVAGVGLLANVCAVVIMAGRWMVGP